MRIKLEIIEKQGDVFGSLSILSLWRKRIFAPETFAKANIETQQLAGSCWFLTWPPIGTHVLYVTLEFSVILIFFWFLSLLALILCWKEVDDLKRSATRAFNCKYNSGKTTICLETVSFTTCRKEKMLENTKKDIFCTNYTLVARSTEKVTRMMC